MSAPFPLHPSEHQQACHTRFRRALHRLSMTMRFFKRLTKPALAPAIVLTGCLLPAPVWAAGPDAASGERLQVVKKGDTLWGIAARRYNTPWKWKKIWKLNIKTIKNPNLIYPGQVFALAPLPPEPGTIIPATVKPVAIQPAAAQPAATQPPPPQHAPVLVIAAHIVSIYTGASQTENGIVVIIDKGRLDGVENGLVLTLYSGDEDGKAPSAASATPAAGYGQARVFRVFDKTAYATTTKANSPVKLLDMAINH